MITLSKKLKEVRQRSENNKDQSSENRINNQGCSTKCSNVLIRDQLLTKEISEIKHSNGFFEIKFPDPNILYKFEVSIKPDDGMWKGGFFKFEVFVPEEYNMKPPVVKCVTKLWHPNISLEGAVCLSILREYSLDGSGWAPTRSIKDVIWGLQSIFLDLVDFEDPLNNEAAIQYYEHPQSFHQKVQSYIFKYAT